ncbi:BCCT family transporter [Nocardiopsis coralliicola]
MLDTLAKRLGLRTDPPIFFASAALACVFVVIAIAFTGAMDRLFGAVSGWVLDRLGWFYILGVTTFLIFLIVIALSRFGGLRLGAEDSRPDYSLGTWFAMLFAAGIGTILMFWGVAEPISHFAEPPRAGVDPGSVAAAEEAMAFTLYHFGLHTWTIFTLPALAFAYFAYRRKLPFRVSSIFHPFLGDRINGWAGRAIDVLAVLGTLFGVAVSIGLGTLQINSGLHGLFGVPEGAPAQIVLIAVVTGIAVVSVALGLDAGIKHLSSINIVMAVVLLLFVFAAGSPLFLARGIIETTGTYLSHLPQLAFWNDTFAHTGWQESWTTFYWAWTITWAPFVGIFIARISRGRTVREFVFGVLGLPTAFSIIWFSVFGLSAINIERSGDSGLVQRVVEEGDIPGALFAFLGHFPAPELMSGFAVLIVVIFFTTSSDSAALVMDMLCNGTSEEAPTRQRVFWGVLTGVVAATLLAATGKGGLEALQDVITVVGLPFFAVAFLMMAALVKAMYEEYGGTAAGAGSRPRGGVRAVGRRRRRELRRAKQGAGNGNGG